MVIMYFVFENTNTSILFANTLLAMYLYLYFKYKFRKYLYFVFKYFLKVFDRTLVATIRVEPVFLAIISKTVNNRCYNPINPYISGKILKRAFQKCMDCS